MSASKETDLDQQWCHTKTSWKSIFHCIPAKKVQKTSLAALTLFNIIFPDA
jgi:hypothetical protein